jgi:hypothetical protein
VEITTSSCGKTTINEQKNLMIIVGTKKEEGGEPR